MNHTNQLILRLCPNHQWNWLLQVSCPKDHVPHASKEPKRSPWNRRRCICLFELWCLSVVGWHQRIFNLVLIKVKHLDMLWCLSWILQTNVQKFLGGSNGPWMIPIGNLRGDLQSTGRLRLPTWQIGLSWKSSPVFKVANETCVETTTSCWLNLHSLPECHRNLIKHTIPCLDGIFTPL